MEAISTSSFHLALLLSSFFIIAVPSASAGRATGKYHVRIANEMGENRQLVVHCKSRDDDLGERQISPGGNPFEFGFKVNFFGSTLFFCNVWKGPDYVQHAVLDVFDADEGFVYTICGGRLCTWIARDNGIYSYNQREMTTSFRESWGTT